MNKFKTLVRVYGLHNGKRILEWFDVTIDEFATMCDGRSIVQHGRHWWLA